MVQSNLKKFMSNCIEIHRQSGESDEFGGVDASWVSKYRKVPCRIYENAGGSQVPGYGITEAGVDIRIDRKMICDKSVDIIEGDKVVDSTYNEEFFVVRVLHVHVKKNDHHLECLLSRTRK